jgi:hypothetical protein
MDTEELGICCHGKKIQVLYLGIAPAGNQTMISG